MSRHRLVRNMNLSEEVAEDDGYDSAEEEYAYDDLDDEQAVQMSSGLIAVRDVLGHDAKESGFTDKEIKDALWDSYFDVEGTIDFFLQEKEKKLAAERRRAEREADKAQKKATAAAAASTSMPRAASPAGSKRSPAGSGVKVPATTTATGKPLPATVSQLRQDIEGLGLSSAHIPSPARSEDGMSDLGGAASPGRSLPTSKAGTPKQGIAHERIVEEVRKREMEGKRELSLVCIGHVDAGKSTLMGRLMHELGFLSDKAHSANERASQKLGKGSFAYAWALDATDEERERGVTIDVGIDSFSTPKRRFTLLDAPGHRDFIPNMITGASQADAAVLVVDASLGAFEAGFGPGGQTREHALLVRSLGVRELVVAVNKMDAVLYDQSRFEDIVYQLRPFLQQSGFDPNKLGFVPVGAAAGENLSVRSDARLEAWWHERTLVEALDALEIPPRSLDGPLRLPITNVFRSTSAIASGVGVSGRVESGIVQVGDKVRIVPGDESGIVRAIEMDTEPAPWAVAGANVTVYLAQIDQVHLAVGSVLCPPISLVPVATSFVCQLIVFDPKYPITSGASVEVFVHALSVPATFSELIATLDKTTGEVVKRKPRMLSKGATAKVRVTVRNGSQTGGQVAELGGEEVGMGPATLGRSIALDTFKSSKELGRVLFRRDGETIAAGIILETFR